MPAEAPHTAHSLHTGTDAIVVVVVPVLAACLRRGSGSFFRGQMGHEEQKKKKGGCGWRLERSPRCQSRSCASSADKEGESVLNWAAVQSNSDWGAGGRGNVGTRLTKAFMFGGGLNGQKRHRDRLSPHAKTEGHSGIWDSIHPATATNVWSERGRGGITAACGKSFLLIYSTSRAELAHMLKNISAKPHRSSLVLTGNLVTIASLWLVFRGNRLPLQTTHLPTKPP